jgi:hypothetical protein
MGNMTKRHSLHTVGVASSKLASPTIFAKAERHQYSGCIQKFFKTSAHASLGSFFFVRSKLNLMEKAHCNGELSTAI